VGRPPGVLRGDGRLQREREKRLASAHVSHQHLCRAALSRCWRVERGPRDMRWIYQRNATAYSSHDRGSRTQRAVARRRLPADTRVNFGGHAVSDLAYVIDSSIYRPGTRRGESCFTGSNEVRSCQRTVCRRGREGQRILRLPQG